MAEPLVCAVTLTRDHPKFVARAVQCFQAQTYQQKLIIVWDTGEGGLGDAGPGGMWAKSRQEDDSVGDLRNLANNFAFRNFRYKPDIFIHFDSDDWSHPHRIAEQVALLQSSKAECVGYHSMYFWDAGRVEHFPTPGMVGARRPPSSRGAAYLYAGEPPYALGTSLCYWRSVWEKRPFQDVSLGEDSKFLDGTNAEGKRIHEPLRVASVSANRAWRDTVPDEQPRMIARIHPDSLSYKAGYRRRLDAEPWSRITDPAVIEYCRKAMEP